MSQFDYGNIDESTTSGTDLGLLLEQSRDANHSSQKGITRPSYVVPGMLWIDDSSTPWIANFFDGVNDLPFASLDATSHILQLTHKNVNLASIATSADFADLINVPGFSDLAVSPTDTTPGDLTAKLITDTGFALSTQNPGANETRTISHDFATQLEAEAGSDNTKPMNALRTKQAIEALGVPTGVVQDFAGATVPLGFLPCDGAAVSRTTFASLFAIIGTGWGIGDGSTTFNVPDLARRATIGSGGIGSGTIGNAVGDTGGAEDHQLTVSELASHSHTDQASNQASSNAGTGTMASAGSHSTQSTGGDQPHNNMQPSAVMLKIIKT